ncbi:hypothetical protein D3C80_1233590 [compost metagenome]
MFVVLPHLGDPALVLHVGPVASGLKEGENARIVARLAEDVQILGRTADPGIGRHRIGAGQQERHPGFFKEAQAFLIEGHGFGRWFKGGFGDGIGHAAWFPEQGRETEP